MRSTNSAGAPMRGRVSVSRVRGGLEHNTASTAGACARSQSAAGSTLAMPGKRTATTDKEGGPQMRFVHTADWQLGMTRYFLNGEAQPRYSAARRDVVAGLGPLAAGAGAEFVVVAGDVFEDNQLAPRDVSLSLEAIRAIGLPVYLLPGNHDPLDAASVYTSPLFAAECPENVTVLDRAGVHDVR